MPHVRQLQEQVGEDKLQVLLLSVDMDYGLPEVEQRNYDALKRIGVLWPNVLVPGGWSEAVERFNMHLYGLWMIYPEGKVVVAGPRHDMDNVYRALGLTPEEGPEEEMDRVLHGD